MKKYFIGISDQSLQEALTRAIGTENVLPEPVPGAAVIDDTNVNNFVAGLFNRSNGILILGSYGKTGAAKVLESIFECAGITPVTVNLGKEKNISLNGDGFCILNPGMNLELVEALKPSVVILTGITPGKKSVQEQSHAYENALKKASVGIVINDDCPEASLYKDMSANTLVYSMKKKADILCKSYSATLDGTEAVINRETFFLKAPGKANISAVMAGMAATALLGFDGPAIKSGSENYRQPSGYLGTIATIAGTRIIYDSSIYPEQMEKNLEFLKTLAKKLILVFSPDPNFQSEGYTEAFANYLNHDATLAVCGDGKNDRYYEALVKTLRKEHIKASFYASRRDVIKDIITKADCNDIIVLMGHKSRDFEDFCEKMRITLENKII